MASHTQRETRQAPLHASSLCSISAAAVRRHFDSCEAILFDDIRLNLNNST